jgi:hypothetical protein
MLVAGSLAAKVNAAAVPHAATSIPTDARSRTSAAPPDRWRSRSCPIWCSPDTRSSGRRARVRSEASRLVRHSIDDLLWSPPNFGEFEHRLIVLLLFLHYLIAMVETIGEAFSLGWHLKARCAFGNREGTKSVRQCTWIYDLDMLTLVATRGRDFPLAMLASRLRCPRCGSRRVAVVFMPPIEGDRRRGVA